MATVTEDITGQVDGAATTFTLTGSYATGTLEVHLNGVRLKRASAPGAGDGDFEEVGPANTSFLWTCPDPPFGSDTLQVQYEEATPGVSFPVVQAFFIEDC